MDYSLIKKANKELDKERRKVLEDKKKVEL